VDSGLVHSVAANGTVTVKPKNDQSVPTLKAITVTGKSGYADNDPYNPNYNRTNSSTATKTDTPIMETPYSIQVVPRAVMNDQQVIRVDDATKNVSGVQTGAADGNYLDAFIVRGFDIGNNTYRNGYRTQRQQSETANLERLEVLKGAAAMLYGRVQPGGLLNLVTKQPLETSYYLLQQQFGSYDLYRTTVDATGPILEDKTLLYRINLAYQDNNSFRDFISTERIFIAPSLTWKATPDTQFNLNLEYKHDKGVDDYGVPAVGNRPAPIPIGRRLGQPGEGFDNDLLLVNFNAEHAFNDDWKVKLGVNANSNDFSQERYPAKRAGSRQPYASTRCMVRRYSGGLSWS
jgi:iron complex outermembrane recepter protein